MWFFQLLLTLYVSKRRCMQLVFTCKVFSVNCKRFTPDKHSPNASPTASQTNLLHLSTTKKVLVCKINEISHLLLTSRFLLQVFLKVSNIGHICNVSFCESRLNLLYWRACVFACNPCKYGHTPVVNCTTTDVTL